MKSLAGFATVSYLALSAWARQFPIPAVNSAVNQALSEYASYTAYAGPTGSAASEIAKSTGARFSTNSVNAAVADPAYWLALVSHQGKSAFNSAGTAYKVWRNVKDFGAKGDGVTDDTAAINAAISSGNRCAPGSCQSSTTTPALVYFPAGTYLISRPIIQSYYTQLHGNPNGRAVLKATAGFSGFALIDANPYQSNGNQAYGSTNVFWRQIRNLVLDLTSIPASSAATALHWPTSQATSLQNLQINLSQAAGTQHVGIFCENGSAGYFGDVVIYGGKIAINIGNQQFTIRNVAIYNAVTAINQLWSWGFTYKSLTITNCSVGIDTSALDTSGKIQQVGAVLVMDSTISNTRVFVKTARNTVPNPPAAGSLLLENIALSGVGVAVQGANGATLLAGGTTTVAGWSQGQSYTPSGPTKVQGPYTPASRPGSLVSGNRFYEASKPQYETVPTESVISLRTSGAVGDGKTDDTRAVQLALTRGASTGKVVFFDAGTYRVTSTIYFPPGAKVVGESYSVIMSSGTFFNDIKNPQPVVQIGKPGASGLVQWSDMIVSTQGAQAGAKLIEWNLAASAGSGMWDVHTRIGGFAGSNLLLANCPTTASPSPSCYAAYLSMHVTKTASGVYLENVWLWTADHDIEDPNLTQISVYAGRGLLYESTAGTGWLYGTCVEHHHLYQYNYVNTKNVVIGHATIETPYYQPVPDAKSGPFPTNATYNDPDFSKVCTLGGNCDAIGLRIAGSNNIHHYGAGLYSFFNKYSTTCSNAGGPENCQSVIFDIESSSAINNYVLSTVGTSCMVYRDGRCLASYADNVSVYPDTIVQFRSG